MAADLAGGDSHFQSLIEAGSLQTGEDLRTLCLRGPEKALRRTAVLQPLIVAVSLGYLRRLLEKGITPDWVLGHSLGEITALAAAGVVAPEQAVIIAARRGRLMEEAAAAADGGMMAVIGPERESVLALLGEPAGADQLTLANDNAPTQIVISGRRPALEAMAQRIGAAKLGTCRILPVAGPWHSPYMATASARFADYLETQVFGKPSIPIVMNYSGQREDDPRRIKENVINAVREPVQWRAAMGFLRSAGVGSLVEIGPGRVLSGLARTNGFGNETHLCTVSSLRNVDSVAEAASRNEA